MHIQVHTVADFLKHLYRVGGGSVYDKLITVERAKMHETEGSWEVILQFAAAIIREKGDFYLDGAESCGKDFVDAQPGESQGSNVADKLEKDLEEACEKLGLIIVPGIMKE